MNNLIINEIDYSIFDLEWAKRGGVVYHYGDFCRYICDGENYNEIRAGQDGEFLIGEEKTVGLVSILTTEKVENSPHYLRMATPYECDAAGVYYIEPPMMWRDIKSAPKNTWVITTDDFYVTEAFFSTPRNEWIMKNGDELSEPTRWMLLPQPQPH
jgi:hypothetical protein